MKIVSTRFGIWSLSLLLFLGGLASPAHARQARWDSFDEQYALASDRAAAIEQLIPGSGEYYYFACLERQAAGDFDKSAELMKLWKQRNPNDPRLGMIANRQALLRHGSDPAETYAYLRKELRLWFGSARALGIQQASLPSRLDGALLDHRLLLKKALARYPDNLRGLRNGALAGLDATTLNDASLGAFLDRLERPDYPGLAELVLHNLSSPRSRRFGSASIHRKLLLAQLETCAQRKPDLLSNDTFVSTYINRLIPNNDQLWHAPAAEREAYLDRLQAFVERLPSSQNSLRAHVYYHRLSHDLALGKPNQKLFLEYLRLPRPASYYKSDLVGNSRSRKADVELNKSFPTGLPRVGNDEALVRAYLSDSFKQAEPSAEHLKVLEANYLRRLYAETKILQGQGDMETWYSLLDDPAYYESLKTRVEIEFSPAQATYFAAGAPVSIDVDLKNVGTLLVKVFEINTLNYSRDKQRDVDASIDLDGLVAGSERTITLDEAPLRRVHRRFEMPELSAPGVYVIELIGNGLSSRAVIHKGRLQLRERQSSAGHILSVLNEAGSLLKQTAVWFGGREYLADARGEILIPFGTNPGSAEVLLIAGKQTTRARFQHAAESYRLEAGIYVNREALVEGGSAQVVVHPRLLLNGRSISLKALDDALLSITSINQDGVATQLVVPHFELHRDRESVKSISVPPGLAQLQVTLQGEVRSLSTGEMVSVKSSIAEFNLNGIDAGLQTDSPLLGRGPAGYVLDVLGKNGEPKAARRVSVRLEMHDFVADVLATLETDRSGRIHLGPLSGVRLLSVDGFPERRSWPLEADRHYRKSVLHGSAGQTLRVPYAGPGARVSRGAFSLIEMRAENFYSDRFDRLSLRGGYLELNGLGVGDYQLVLRESQESIRVRVSQGKQQDGYLVGRDRHLEATPVAMQISDLGLQGKDLVIQLAHPGAGAVVHVFATRYVPAYNPFYAFFPRRRSVGRYEFVQHSSSSYHSGREISDEYRYILERRYAQPMPGNMLARPGLVLNPWALEETDSVAISGGAAGGAFEGRAVGKRNLKLRGGSADSRARASSTDPGVFPNLDFLPNAPGMLLNLRPDAQGVVRVPLSQLGPGALLHVLASDDESEIYRTLTRKAGALVLRDKRLIQGLDASKHLAQQQGTASYRAGDSVVIEDASNARLKVYDSLSSVHQLYSTLSGNPDLAAFDFVLRWPELTPEGKREQYSKHACHELHFFLHEKDPAFFAAVVKPYLSNKSRRTFLDDWLLGRELGAYLDPWAFAQLNAFERILLTRRVPGQGASGQRHLREILELSPPSPERLGLLFETALQAGSLEQNAGLSALLDEVKQVRRDALSAPALSSEVMRALESLGYAGDDEMEEEPGQPNGKAGSSEFFLGRGEEEEYDQARRGQVRQLYRAPDPTRPYIENNYWHLTPAQSGPGLITPNAFWLDYAMSPAGQPFASVNFAEASGSFAEMMLALAVLDLPFKAGEQAPTQVKGRLLLPVSAPLIVVSEEIKPAPEAPGALPILVSQSFFRADDRYRFEGAERLDKPVTDEFVMGVAYGALVVVTNPNSSPRPLELLLQIPVGALPLARGLHTRGKRMRLEPYGTRTVEYYFYFPVAGEFSHYPVHVSRAGQRIGSAPAFDFHVVPKATRVDTKSWQHVSQDGTNAEVIAYLEQANLLRVKLSMIAWRMRDKAFFQTLIAFLRERHHFDQGLWSYGLLHEDDASSREYLSNAHSFVQRCGVYLESPLLNIDPAARGHYQEMQFSPLINPRAHRFGSQRKILDLGFAAQYASLIEVLVLRPTLDSADRMRLTYALLLQDRVQEAQECFARVQVQELPTRMQYDYMRAYLDFYTAEHALARGIAEGYRDHPVERWRLLFREVLAQLDEAEGKASGATDGGDLGQQQTALVNSEASLELSMEGQRVMLEHQNLDAVTVSYYEMDIEFLFSTSPFVQQGSGSFAYIRPNQSAPLSLAKGQTRSSFELPAEFAKSNVLVEVRAAGMVRREAHYANSLVLSTFERYGQIKVVQRSTGKPLGSAYVKVFARAADGSVRFHKDGYTDLRGRFDYASLTGASDLPAERYSILVMSVEDGALIREVAPPKR